MILELNDDEAHEVEMAVLAQLNRQRATWAADPAKKEERSRRIATLEALNARLQGRPAAVTADPNRLYLPDGVYVERYPHHVRVGYHGSDVVHELDRSSWYGRVMRLLVEYVMELRARLYPLPPQDGKEEA